VLPHVLEADGSGLFMLQVCNQLTEDPSLIRILDPPVLVLHHCLGEDSPPRQVPKVYSAKLPTINGNGHVVWPAADLIGDRQDSVEFVLPGQVEVTGDLICL
jgi:hypothetical protein